MIEALEAEIFGRVQGVGYRIFVKAEAEKFGLKGHVSNTDHGTVKLIACGKKDKLEEFLSKLRSGPLFAKVDKVDYSFGYCDEKFDGFSIIRDKRGIIRDQRKAFTNFLTKLLPR